MSESEKHEITFSFVSPVYNEQEGLETFYKRLSAVAIRLGEPYEIIFVNDGSTDDSMGVIHKLMAGDSHVKYVDFSRNFGHQMAVTAGYDYANGKAVISMDSDCQHPPELIPDLVAKWHEGYEVVYTIRKATEGISALQRGFRRLVYKAIRSMSGADVTDQADFRLMDRKAVLALRQTREQARFVRGLVNWIGFRQIGIPYIAESRKTGKSTYTFRQSARMAMAGLCNFSLKPLRIAPVVGAILLAASVGYFGVALVLWVLGQAPSAMTHMAMAIVALFGMQFLMMGLLGEYIGRVFEQAKERPLYVIRETRGFERVKRPVESPATSARLAAPEKPKRFLLYT